MRDAGSRPIGWLFYWALVLGTLCAIGLGTARAQTGPAMTTISDTVSMADGSPAEGTLIITWPAFVTASGAEVAAGTTSVALGANGALNVALVPNAGATPAGVYYSVVYQLGPGEVKTESWVVPSSSSPVNLAAVTATPGAGIAGQAVSMQYVNSELAAKANDNAVVHLTGAETITGTKTFASAPSVPAPVNPGDVASKGYVDQSVSNVGAGNYLPTAGGTMTEPITLPANPASQVAAPIILFDDVIAGAPGCCSYALVNAVNMQCSIAYTYASHVSLTEVRLALPNAAYATQVVASLSDGGQCEIASSTTLDFYPQYVPPLNALIVATYRGSGRAVAEVTKSTSIASLANGADNGARGIVRTMKTPSARTQADCENAALAILDDADSTAWAGAYETWSDFLPSGAEDIFPGDALALNVPSRGAACNAIVRAVAIDMVDTEDDRAMYTIEFANDWAEALAYQDEASATTIPLTDMPPRITKAQVGTYYLANLTNAQITQVSSTTVSIDIGVPLPSGCGVEVRAHDYGWGVSNDRNLLGRFSSQTFTLPRVARTQNYFLRLYNTFSPPQYSRYAAALHVDIRYERRELAEPATKSNGC
jgi:hypothetical protein